MADFDTIQSQNFAQRDRFKRVSQRDMIPLAVKERHWLTGKLYFFGPVFTFTDVLTLSNGGDDSITITLSHNDEFDLIVSEMYTSLYQGSAEDSTLEIPGGSSVTESQWIWTPFSWNYSQYKNSAFKARYRSTGKIYIRNVSAGASTDVTLVVQAKYMAGSTTS